MVRERLTFSRDGGGAAETAMMPHPPTALQALLHGAIDYAGLFPPAKLEMAAAAANYARYRQEAEGWMLGRFICPASRLKELTPWHGEMMAAERPWRLSALGRGGETVASFLENLRTDLAEIAAFREQTAERVVVDVLEVKVPTELQRDGNLAGSWLAETYATLERHGPPIIAPYFEAAPTGPLTPLLAALAEEEFSPAAESRLRCLPGGFKLRCGGTEPAAFPTPEQVAAVIAACRDDDLPLKFTAGLHHPIRRYDPPLQVTMHGFLNVLLAALFAYQGDWTEAELLALLKDEEIRDFQVTAEALRWRDHVLPADQIAALREEYGLTFGSCSFDEPRDDLGSLGWLPIRATA